MASYDVSALSELADLARVEERSLADQSGRDEEMAAPPAPAQLLTHSKGAFAAVIKGEEQMASRPAELDLVNQRGRGKAARDAIAMLPVPVTQKVPPAKGN